MSTLREAAIGAMGALETARNGLAWYRDRYPESTDGSDDEAAGDIDAAIDALRAELAKPDAPMVQDGWQLVPVGLTEAMHVAGVRTIVHCTGNDDWPPRVWHAMLADAPRPAPAEPQPERDFAAEVDHWMKRSKEWRKRAEAAEALLSAQPPAPQPAGGEPQPAAQQERKPMK